MIMVSRAMAEPVKVDPARQDDQRRADGDDGHDARLERDVVEVVQQHEPVRGEADGDRHDNQRDDRPHHRHA
jgi:hypothetical protein